MVYEWDTSKRDECYRMYITEKKPLEEIIEFYRAQNFVPRYVVDSTSTASIKPALAEHNHLIFISYNQYFVEPCTLLWHNHLHAYICRSTCADEHSITASGLFRRVSKNGVSQRSTVLLTRMPTLRREFENYGKSTRETSRCSTSSRPKAGI